MKLIWIIIPLILIGIVGSLFIASQTSQFQRDEIEDKNKTILETMPSITITGIIQHWQPIDGPSYSIIPEEKINVNMADNQIFLYGEKLNSSLHDKKVKVTGKLIENYVEHSIAIGMPIFGGDPNTAVMFVSDIEIIDNEPNSIPKQKESMIIKTGWWSGECVGRCDADMTLTSKSMIFHSNGGSFLSGCPTINEEIISPKNEWTSFIELIDLEKFKELSDVIGSPGATDHPISHIEILDGNYSKRVTFETFDELQGHEEFTQKLGDTFSDLSSKYFTSCR